MPIETFRTEVDVNIISKLVLKNIDMSGKIYDYISFEKVAIDWGVSIDTNSTGIYGILFAAPDQIITLEGHYATELHPDKEETFSVGVEIKDVKISIDKNLDNEDISIVPHEIDYYNGKWTLEF